MDRETYDRLWNDAAAMRQYLDELLKSCPELFPTGIEHSFQLTGHLPESKKLPGIRLRQWRLTQGGVFTLRPSFVLSCMAGTVDEVDYPKTGQPVRLEMTAGMDGSTKVTASDFVFNAHMDESLFSVEPPAGYTVRYEKIDASPREEKDLIAMFREYSRLTGTLPASLDMKTVQEIVRARGNAEVQWDRVTPGLGKVTEEQKRRYMEVLLEKSFAKEVLQLECEITWENIAPENVRANEEQKRKSEELMLKAAEGRMNNEQFEKEIREIRDDQMLKAMDARRSQEIEARKIAAAPGEEEARTRKFTESQQRVQRGLEFAERLSPASDGHYVGKGVSPGEADKPIFWYRPHDSKKYRVIYADFSVREADTAPSVPESHRVPAPDNPR